jgi:hypothetical protein
MSCRAKRTTPECPSFGRQSYLGRRPPARNDPRFYDRSRVLRFRTRLLSPDRFDLSLRCRGMTAVCANAMPVSVWSRHKAATAGRESGSRNSAGNAPSAASSGRTGFRGKAAAPLRRGTLHHPMRTFRYSSRVAEPRPDHKHACATGIGSGAVARDRKPATTPCLQTELFILTLLCNDGCLRDCPS